MQSPSDHFLRAINTDFDRIIAMCKTWQVTTSPLYQILAEWWTRFLPYLLRLMLLSFSNIYVFINQLFTQSSKMDGSDGLGPWIAGQNW